MALGRFAGVAQALGNRNYGLYVAGNSVSLIGTWIQPLAGEPLITDKRRMMCDLCSSDYTLAIVILFLNSVVSNFPE